MLPHSRYSYSMVDIRHTIAAIVPLLISSSVYAADEATPAWTYDRDGNGQDDWADLSNHYIACGIGFEQSPVAIGATESAKLPALTLHYIEGQAHVIYKDLAITIEVAPGSTLEDGGVTYELKQIQFHSPSEHRVKGRNRGLEIEYQHESRDGKKLILSVFANGGKTTLPALDPVLAHAPDRAGKESDITFNPQSLLPTKRDYYAYLGSLTIPPCTEGVEWRILKKSIAISREQLMAIGRISGRNARLPQALYMRTIRESE